jgi:hypothetical protein
MCLNRLTFRQTFRQVAIAVGVAAWGAIFLARGADKISAVAAGTPAATGDHPRQLIEAASGGKLQAALQSVPHGARAIVANATRDGFLSGLNTILVIGAALAFAGALLALWLVREHEIEREQPELIAPAEHGLEAIAAVRSLSRTDRVDTTCHARFARVAPLLRRLDRRRRRRGRGAHQALLASAPSRLEPRPRPARRRAVGGRRSAPPRRLRA